MRDKNWEGVFKKEVISEGANDLFLSNGILVVKVSERVSRLYAINGIKEVCQCVYRAHKHVAVIMVTANWKTLKKVALNKSVVYMSRVSLVLSMLPRGK